MGGVLNFRNAYEFDPETDAAEGGGLPGMLRRAMAAQGIAVDLPTNGARGFNEGGYPDPQGDLLGRFLALQAGQRGYQSGQGNTGSTTLTPTDPNFRRLARAPSANPPASARGPSLRPDDPSRPYSLADNASLYSPDMSGQGAST